jgi:hypothetical protein
MSSVLPYCVATVPVVDDMSAHAIEPPSSVTPLDADELFEPLNDAELDPFPDVPVDPDEVTDPEP